MSKTRGYQIVRKVLWKLKQFKVFSVFPVEFGTISFILLFIIAKLSGGVILKFHDIVETNYLHLRRHSLMFLGIWSSFMRRRRISPLNNSEKTPELGALSWMSCFFLSKFISCQLWVILENTKNFTLFIYLLCINGEQQISWNNDELYSPRWVEEDQRNVAKTFFLFYFKKIFPLFWSFFLFLPSRASLPSLNSTVFADLEWFFFYEDETFPTDDFVSSLVVYCYII